MLLTASHFSSHPLPAFGEEPLLLRVIAHLGLICTSMIIDCEHFLSYNCGIFAYLLLRKVNLDLLPILLLVSVLKKILFYF